MSDKVREVGGGNERTVKWTLVESGRGYFIVSTVSLFDAPPELSMLDGILGTGGGRYETGVFPANAEGEVTSWRDELMVQHADLAEAKQGHEDVVGQVLEWK